MSIRSGVVLLVHAGNRVDHPDRSSPRFPSSTVPAVRARVRRLLADLRPNAVVSAAAAGADLIVLGEAIDAGIAVHVALPLTTDEFSQRSVADLGEAWQVEYERVLAHATLHGSVSIDDLSDDDDWYLNGNDCILDRAALVAQSGAGEPDSVYALVLRPHGGDGARSATDHFAALAAGRGWPVIELPLTPGS
jgi:hypothetical protein